MSANSKTVWRGDVMHPALKFAHRCQLFLGTVFREWGEGNRLWPRKAWKLAGIIWGNL